MDYCNQCYCGDPGRLSTIHSKLEVAEKSGVYYFIEVNFERVVVGSETKKIIHIQNDSKLPQLYSLERRSNINMGHYDFDCYLSTKNKVIKPNQVFQCKITYRPIYPNEKNFDRFEILDTSLNRHIILCRGESIGPNVKASVKTLCFYNIKDYTSIKKTFEITNSSSAETLYQFDFRSDVFSIDKTKGIISSKGRCFITVTFKPKKEGIYSDRLWCLLLYQEPILIELIGINHPETKYDLKTLVLKPFPVPFQYRTGNTGYFENTSVDKYIPPVTLTPTSIFFNNENRLPFAIKNNSYDEVRITWFPDEEKIFSILPEHIIVPPQMYVKFKCRFTPKSQNEIYSQTLKAEVRWYDVLLSSGVMSTLGVVNVDQTILHIPLYLSLLCTAHSFDRYSGWISTADVIPKSIVLPPCVGSSNSWANFQIKSNSSLPLLFNIIAPKGSNVTMKPNTGVIKDGSTQIVTAQFNPPSTETFTGDERWQVTLNGQSNNIIPIYVKFQCDIPSMVVGDRNVIEFPCIQVGWKQCMRVLLKNTSLFEIKYTLVCEDNEYLEIEEPEGYIGANEEYYVNMYFTGNLCAPPKSLIICKCEAVQRSLLIGQPVEITVNVHAQCAYSQLCALPKDIDFGEVDWNATLDTKFHIFNFGQAPITFELFSNDVAEGRIILTPKTGTVETEQNICVNLKLRAEEIGNKSIQICYRLPSTSEGAINLIRLDYNCTYPTFQIAEIIEHTFSHIFSKSTLWKMFNIEKLNETLQSIGHDETKTVVCHLPDYEVGNDVFSMKLLLANRTNFNVDLSLKRVKICPCEYIETESFTFRKKIYNCPHRKMLLMDISHTQIKSNSKEILTLQVKYSEIGENKVCYMITLSHNRCLEIIIEMNSIVDEICTLSTLKPYSSLNFQEVFIGLRNPPLQCFWLYNNSSNSVTYHVDDLELIKVCNEEGFNVLSCFNPVDEVKPYSTCPIVFHFHPIETKDYYVPIPLLLGDRLVELQLSGKGTMERKNFCISDTSMPVFSRTMIESYVNISVDEINIKELPLWSSVERLIFIRNTSKDKIFRYHWGDCYVEGILNIDTNDKEGLLHPKEIRKVLIRINSMGESILTNLVLSCKLLDYNHLLLYKKSKEKEEEKLKNPREHLTSEDESSLNEKVEPSRILAPTYSYITVGINLEIVDSMDYFFNGDIEQMFKNPPRNMIKINKDRIMENYIGRMTQIDPPIGSSTKDPYESETKPSTNKLIDATSTSIESLDENAAEVISETMTKLIAEVVFSDTFRKIIESDENDFPPYYAQYKLDGQSVLEESLGVGKRVGLSTERAEETKKFLNYPEPEQLSETMKHLLNETIDILFFRDRAD